MSDRFGPLRTVVVAANGEEPLVARLRLAAGRCEGRPGDAALDGPAFVAVAGLVERSFQGDDGLAAQGRGRREIADALLRAWGKPSRISARGGWPGTRNTPV